MKHELTYYICGAHIPFEKAIDRDRLLAEAYTRKSHKKKPIIVADVDTAIHIIENKFSKYKNNEVVTFLGYKNNTLIHTISLFQYPPSFIDFMPKITIQKLYATLERDKKPPNIVEIGTAGSKKSTSVVGNIESYKIMREFIFKSYKLMYTIGYSHMIICTDSDDAKKYHRHYDTIPLDETLVRLPQINNREAMFSYVRLK